MKNIKIKVFQTSDEVDGFVSQQIIRATNYLKNPVIGFATGYTPQGAYKNLIGAYRNMEVDFSQTTAFNLDEYVGISNEHRCSFAKSMRDNLFNFINIPKEKIRSLDGTADDMEKECRLYEEAIIKEPIDIQLLGIGMDGHIAYNEPGTSFSSSTHVVHLYPESIKSSLDYGFNCIEEVPHYGVTQGIATIMKAKQLLVVAKGSKKALLVKRMLKEDVNVDFPSTIIQKHPNVLVVLDEKAATYLQEETYERN